MPNQNGGGGLLLSESVPESIDVSEYTEFMCVGVGLVNKHESQGSSCNIYFNDNYNVRFDTQANKSPSSTKTQYIFAEYNGLVFRQYKMPVCGSNTGVYDNSASQMQAPYTYSVMNMPLSKLSVKYNASIYTCISGNLKVYAR